MHPVLCSQGYSRDGMRTIACCCRHDFWVMHRCGRRAYTLSLIFAVLDCHPKLPAASQCAGFFVSVGGPLTRSRIIWVGLARFDKLHAADLAHAALKLEHAEGGQQL